MNTQLPLEQKVAHRREPFQYFFAVRAMEVVPRSEDYVLEPETEGLRLHAACETALARPGEILRDAFGDALSFSAPEVKLTRHAGVDYEPVMYVRTEVAAQHQAAVRAALLARGATLLEEDVRRTAAITRATCPLRRLLGFNDALRRLAGEQARSWVWLSHYQEAARDMPKCQGADRVGG